MADQLELPVENQQPQAESESEHVSIAELRQQDATERPHSRRPYAHAEQPFQREKWKPETEGESKREPESKGGFQRRIDRLTKEKSDLERRLAEAEAGRNQQPQQPEVKPQGQQYETIDAMTARVLREAADREKNSAQQKPSTEADQKKQHEDFQKSHAAKSHIFQQRLQAAVKSDPEFAEITKKNSAEQPLAPAILRVAMVEQQNGPDVAVYLAKKPEMVRRIAMLWQTSGEAVFQATGNAAAAEQAANVAVFREVNRIASALEFGTAMPAAPRPVERPVSQAPEPIKPVGGAGGGPAEADPDSSDEVDLRRLQKKAEAARYPRRR